MNTYAIITLPVILITYNNYINKNNISLVFYTYKRK